MLDVASAIALAEKAVESRVIGDTTENGDIARAIGEAIVATERGERVAVVAPVERLASMRDALRRVAMARLGLVAHAIAGHGAEELSALSDLGWGVLSAAGPEDSFDLTLVARRAAEDSGVPFLVVHGFGRASFDAGRAVAMVGLPQDQAVRAFVGAPGRIKAEPRRSATDRVFAERAPFALGAALREFGSVSGRRRDAFDKTPLGETPLVLVGSGPVGDALFGATTELRARGYDVGAIHVTSLRPFPGPRLVKALARALAITVLEPVDEPLAHGAMLARDVKSAFTDALTWVPGFPGIGRIPKLFIGAAGSAFDVSDLALVCDNMLADERGHRVFSFVDVERALPHVSRPSGGAVDSRTDREIAIRFVLDDVVSADAVLLVVASVLANGVGLRTHGIVTATPGASAVLDILASRDHARGGMARRSPRLVFATERGVSSAGAVVPLAEGAVLAVVSAEPTGTVPEAARAALRERGARVLPLAVGDHDASSMVTVAAGVALAVASRALKSPVSGDAAAELVVDALRSRGDVAGIDLEAAGQRARHAFESMCEVLTVAKSERVPGRGIGVA